MLPERGRIVIDGQDVTALAGAGARAADRARVPGPARRQLRGADDRGEPGARRGARAARAACARRSTATLRERLRARLARLGLGLEHRLADRMGLLSGGQRQAVSLLMATLAPMKILLLDEHTAALDPKTAEFVLELTREIVAEQRLTTLMVTHSMRQALDCGTRTVMLHEGRICFDVAGRAARRPGRARSGRAVRPGARPAPGRRQPPARLTWRTFRTGAEARDRKGGSSKLHSLKTERPSERKASN